MRWTRAAFAIAVLALIHPLSGETRIHLQCQNAGLCAADGTLLVTIPGAEEVRLPLRAGVATTDVQLSSESEARLVTPGFWAPSQRLRLRPSGTWTIDAWKTTPLTGRFTAATGDAIPSELRVDVMTPQPARIPRVLGTVDCAVGQEGKWSCDVPAVPADLVIRAKSFVPHYVWDAALETARRFDVGEIRLKRGASLVAWLDRDSASRLTGPARARLTVMAADDGTPASQRLRTIVVEGVVNKRGVVQLAPLAPGKYTLEVVAPGFAPARVHHVEIIEGSESTLARPIVLDPPLTIRLTLDPPRHPAGSPWTVEWFRADDFTGRSVRVTGGAVDDQGAYEVAEQAPGRYTVFVRAAGNDLYATRELTIAGAADATHAIRLDVVLVRGKTLLGGEPVEAALLFGGKGGKEKIRATADAEGAFEAVLPRKGRWVVEVSSPAAGVESVTHVNIGESGDVVIDLPATEVAGWVVDAAGERVADAMVTLVADGGAVNRRTAADGTYRFRGAVPGEIMLSAKHGASGEQSPIVRTTLPEDGRLPDVILQLQRSEQFRGVLTSAGRPLPGARVTGYGFGQGVARRQAAVSDVDGAFTLPVAEGVTSVVLLVGAAGRTFHAFSVPRTGQVVPLDVASAGGVLRLRYPRDATRPHLAYQQAVIPLADAIPWARAQGAPPPAPGAVDLPAMAPGPYRFCATPAERPEVCREGTLAAGATLTLAIE